MPRYSDHATLSGYCCSDDVAGFLAVKLGLLRPEMNLYNNSNDKWSHQVIELVPNIIKDSRETTLLFQRRFLAVRTKNVVSFLGAFLFD